MAYILTSDESHRKLNSNVKNARLLHQVISVVENNLIGYEALVCILKAGG